MTEIWFGKVLYVIPRYNYFYEIPNESISQSFYFSWWISAVWLHFMVNFICLFIFYCKFHTCSCLFIFYVEFQLFVYISWWISPVYLQFPFKISYLFTFHGGSQLFVYIVYSVQCSSFWFHFKSSVGAAASLGL